MGISSHVFQLWEKVGRVNDLFDGWGWGGTGRDWVELAQTHFKYLYSFQHSVSTIFLYVGGPLVYQFFFLL